jgi:predicted RNase H-like HicB family nuclease
MKFYNVKILVEKESEDEGYFAYSPNLPGCFSNGKTLEEARLNMREAVPLHLESLRAHNQSIPRDSGIVHFEELMIGVPE